MELLLEVLEQLLALPDRASHRSAAYLAQSCSALRASQPGKRARCFHALASKGLSVPSWLPENIEYETEALETSRWPHLAPHSVSNDLRVSTVSEGSFGRDGRIVDLSQDCKSLHCYTLEANGDCFPEEVSNPSQAKLEILSASKKAIQLNARVRLCTATTDSRFCIVLYESSLSSVQDASEIIEVRDMQTGVRRAKLCLAPSDGFAMHRDARIDSLHQHECSALASTASYIR